MRRIFLVFVLFAATTGLLVHGQQVQQQPAKSPAPAQTPAKVQAAKSAPFTLSIDNIMKGPKLIGNAPTAIRWSPDSSRIYFSWQKPGEERANTYSVSRDGSDLKQLTPEDVRQIPSAPTGRFDPAHKRTLAAEGGDIVIYDVASNARRPLMRTSAVESSPRWARGGNAVTFMRDGNLHLMALDGAVTTPAEIQLTDVVAAAGETAGAPGGAAQGRGGAAAMGVTGGRGGAQGGQAAQGGRGATDQTLTDSQRVLRDENRNLIEYLKNQQGRGGRGGDAALMGGRGAGGRGSAGGAPVEPIARFQPGPRQSVTDMVLSKDEHFVFIGVTERPETAARNQDVPTYVTDSAYPEMTNGRTNVGDSQTRRLLAILDLKQNKVTWADPSAFAGKERPAKPTDTAAPRIVDWTVPDCSEDGTYCVTAVRSQDNKDRWFVTIDPATGKATPIDALHDDAWIREGSVSSGTIGAAFGGGMGGGGFGGMGSGMAWLPDNKRFLFLAEKDGWMHVYSLDMSAPKPAAKQLTSGKWEVVNARLSNDRTNLFLTTSEVHPGEHHFYTMSVDGGPPTRITTMTGDNEVTVSPDEKTLAVLYSYLTKPPELYVMPFTAAAKARQVTTTPTPEWLAFKWIDSKVISFKARDGAMVYARLYTPEMIGAKRDSRHPGIVFAHGAGYLQFATKGWSQNYYREQMFNHFLVSRGYVVIAPDYRASSGYGRDWRTAVYRHMGGQDLDDCVDAAKFIVSTEKVDPKRIGIYGGSYGGFLTLMGMFTTPDVFAAGAALRPVTDWSHYNHGYTAPILNLPQNDLEAYKQSSPIYFAQGLKGQLLICHGMVDTNVFFQDSVRLIQRLIELRKETWAIAPYPVENHNFSEETSWADEYKRIFKLFEEYVRGVTPGKTTQ